MGSLRHALSQCLFILCAIGCQSGNHANGSPPGSGGSEHAGSGGLEQTSDSGSGGDNATWQSGTSTAGAANPSSAGAAQGVAGAASMTECPPPLDLGVRFVGRFDGCAKDSVRFAWSGSGFVAAFTGSGISVRLRGRDNQFTVLVDGVLQPKLVTAVGEAFYTLATGLSVGKHIVEVYRRTEASFGYTGLVSVEVENGQLEVPPAAPARLIEVIGDSISCGYGNEGSAPCAFSADTENHYLTYGALLARGFGAELSTVAWSGKGVVSNWGGSKTELIPLTYDRVVPTEKRSIWTFVPQPQLVIINAGTNDFSADTDPTEADFVAAYTEFLATIREHYPSAYILCTVGPMLSGSDLTEKAQPFIAAAVQARHEAGDMNVEAYAMQSENPDAACDSHPNLLTHAAMAEELTDRVRTVLGW